MSFEQQSSTLKYQEAKHKGQPKFCGSWESRFSSHFGRGRTKKVSKELTLSTLVKNFSFLKIEKWKDMSSEGS